MSLTAEERRRYSRELAEYTMRQFAAARKTLDNHKAAAAKLPALHAARDGSIPGHKGLYDQGPAFSTKPDKTTGHQLPTQQKSVPT
jgi:hypothetical protein